MNTSTHSKLNQDNPNDTEGFLSKSRTVAHAGFNRWLVPPAALAIHLCIGMAYGFSVFWLPLSKALGVKAAIQCGPEIGFFQELFITTCDWKISTLGWMYTLFFVLLGSSAALWGGWLERVGPRKAGVVSALCWCGGMLISALGVQTHQFWIMILGSGVIGGIGLGLGYISPVSTLIKWFPDHRGMATGMAIMGFGGGAMIGSPMAADLMKFFASDVSVGVVPTFMVMAVVYFVFMMGGALSLFNIGGRFVWASLSDFLGRKMTYVVFFVLGAALYASVPSSAAAGNQILFVSAFCLILSMYGGGFATVPAYLADLFGTQMVGAIHGRLLTAWATAGILGPVVVNYMRDYQLSLGIPREQVYDQTMYILVGMLAVGLVCNLLIKPVDAKFFMTADELLAEKKLAHERAAASETQFTGHQESNTSGVWVWLAWTAVGLPMAWGVYRTLLSVAKFLG